MLPVNIFLPRANPQSFHRCSPAFQSFLPYLSIFLWCAGSTFHNDSEALGHVCTSHLLAKNMQSFFHTEYNGLQRSRSCLHPFTAATVIPRWRPPLSSEPQAAFADGACTDNSGLLALLQRRVQRIVWRGRPSESDGERVFRGR